MELKDVAKEYIRKGLSVIPTDSEKRPTLRWEEFQNRKMSSQEVDTAFQNAKGIALVAGAISGNVEVIDVDCKYDLSGTLYDRLIEAIPSEIIDRLVIAKTRNKGYHLIYRCANIGRNVKLACRLTTAQEKEQHVKDKIRVLIETRAEGGYILVYPSEGYSFEKKGELQEISVQQRELLLDICGSFNEVFDEVEAYEQYSTEKENKFLKSPFDDFNERGDLLGVLTSCGWRTVFQSGSKTRVIRPGRVTSASSGFYDEKTNRLCVFSTSSELDGSRTYNASEIFCRMLCAGDWKRCYKELITKGYGQEINYDNTIRKYIHFLKHSTLLQLLKEKFPDGEIVGEKFIHNEKTYSL